MILLNNWNYPQQQVAPVFAMAGFAERVFPHAFTHGFTARMYAEKTTFSAFSPTFHP